MLTGHLDVLKTDGSGNLSFGADTEKILQYKIVKTDGISTTQHHTMK